MAIYKKSYLSVIFLLAYGSISIICPFQSFSESNSPETVANEIYYQVLSPFCPGRSLADCPSTKANELKVEILDSLKSGKSKAETLNMVFQKYGDEFNSKPPLTGFAAFAWIIPLAFVLLALTIIYRKIRRDIKKPLT